MDGSFNRNDFDLNKIKDKKTVCDAVQVAERIAYKLRN
jgi:hypothetical protein